MLVKQHKEPTFFTLTTSSEKLQSTPSLTNVISSQPAAPISSETINSSLEDEFGWEEKEKQYRLQRLEERQEKAKKKAELEQRKLKLEFEIKQRELERKQREHEEQMREVEEKLQLRLLETE